MDAATATGIPSTTSAAGTAAATQVQASTQFAPSGAPPTMPPVATTMPAQPQGWSVNKFFSSVNWSEVIIMGVGATALFFVIYYHRYGVVNAKTFQTTAQNKFDELEMKIADLESAAKSQSSQAAAQLFN